MLEDILTFKDWDDLGELQYQHYDAVFQKDFGPWKKGTLVPFLTVDFERGLFQEMNRDGTVNVQCNVKLVAVA